jgi:signal transduction histidine kinase
MSDKTEPILAEAPRARPDWWPQGEPWPPQDWRRARRRFLLRTALAVGLLMALIAGACILVFGITVLSLDWPAAPPFGAFEGDWRRWQQARPRSFICGPLVWLIVISGVIFLLRRAFRSVIAPMGDVMAAAQRIEQGDFSARAKERGNRDVRRLARSFNGMAARLEANDVQRKRMIADITHELRTPLTIIQGNLEGMIDGIYPRDEVGLRAALEESRVMARLVEDLRLLSLADTGALKLQKERTTIDELIDDITAAFASKAQRAGVTLSAVTEPRLPPVEIDTVRIREVLSNLISNALKHTPAGGSITIEARKHDAVIEIVVRDTGAGIAPEDLPHVFERFYKASDSRGTGLGLAIARSWVQAHGGDIRAESAPGVGTAMTFTLPLP